MQTTKPKKIKYKDLGKVARSMQPKQMCIIYSKFKNIRDIWDEVETKYLRFIHYEELHMIEKDNTKLYTLEGLKFPGYEIEDLEMEYESFLQQVRITPKGIFHIRYIENGEDRGLLCSKTYTELYDEQEYTKWNSIIHGSCSKCDAQYEFYKHLVD